MFKRLKRSSRRAEDTLRRLFRPRDPKLTNLDLKYTDWDGLETLTRALNENAEAFGQLSPAVDRLSRCIKMLDDKARACPEYATLGADINELFQHLARYLGESAASLMARDNIANFARRIDEEIKLLTEEGTNGGPEMEWTTKQTNKVLGSYRRVRTLLALFLMTENTRMWKVDDDEVLVGTDWSPDNSTEQDRVPQTARLELLPHSPEARYGGSNSEHGHRNGCTPNTRSDILQELRDWVHYGKFQNIFWLSGTAGTGKTTIAYSLCEYLENSGKPSASFFCSRHEPACRDVNRVIPSLSYQLAQLSRPFRCAISSPLKQDPEVYKWPIHEQFEKLIAVPLQEVRHTFDGHAVLVIDALEECEDKDGVRQILDTLFKWSPDLPFRVLITSRPNLGILDHMLNSQGGHMRSELRLHEINRTTALGDIKTYLAIELENLNLPDDDLRRLAQRSGGWFVYAASIVSYIDQQNSSGRAERLMKLLDLSLYSGIHYDGNMDMLYTAILTEAHDRNAINYSSGAEIMLVLHTAVCAREPVTLNTVVGLLGLDYIGVVQTTLQYLLPVLRVSESGGLGITLDQLFAQYLVDPQRSGRFHCDVEAKNESLARLCLRFINTASSPFNVCNLKSSYLLDREVPDIEERVGEAISEELWYATRYWASHLQLALHSDDLMILLDDFFSKRLLLWMEIINLKHCTHQGVNILRGVYTWLKGIGPPTRIQDLVYDAWMFMTWFSASAMSDSTPHLYISALRLWPTHRTVSTCYRPKMRSLVRATGAKLGQRDPVELAVITPDGPVTCVVHSPRSAGIVSVASGYAIYIMDVCTGKAVGQPLQGHTGSVNSVSYSPDGAYIASGSYDKTIRIWNAQTGQLMGQPLQGHSRGVNSVSYSPDGAYIVSGSSDETIRIWNAQTGQPVDQPLQSHSSHVTSVAYSPNGAYIVSGSYDETIRIWDAQTGQPVGQPFRGHSREVMSVAYSPDGAYIVSGSFDKTIRIWDARTGQPMGRPLQGQSGWVRSVAYSPDGAYILSGSSDKIIRIWNARTGQPVGQPLQGHSDWVMSVAYSPDGAYILSGSSDETIRIWNAQTGQPVGQPLRGHSRRVLSAAYSPNGAHIVSGLSNKTICIWDARTGQPIGQPLRGHLAEVTSVAYSPSGAYIVSGSYDTTIRIWDARTSQPVGQPLRGHSGWVTSVAYSPDGAYILSGSDDNTTRIWDAQTGQPGGQPLRGHSDCVTSVAYSPDGAYILSGSDDNTTRIWDAQTGQPVGQPLRGHSDSVTSVAYSPDGAYIMSGSGDNTICVWDARTSQPVGQPLRGHTDSVTSLAYSPGGAYIASGSYDKTIRIWNAQTGQPVGNPLRGHSGRVWSVAYSPDGAYILSGSDDNTIRTWHARTPPVDSPVESLTLPIPSSTAHRATRSPLASTLARYFAPTRRMVTSSTVSEVQSLAEHSPTAAAFSLDDWTLNEQGWVVITDQTRLLWVPRDVRPFLAHPRTAAVFASDSLVALDFRDAKLGTEWQDCFDPGQFL